MDVERKDVWGLCNPAGRGAGLRGAFPWLLSVMLPAVLLAPAVTVDAASLRPSRPSLLRQVYAAHDHGYPYARSAREVRDLVSRGHLVRLAGNRDYELKESMSFPYARREVRLFIERLARQYRSRCGEKLTVTSLVRPKTRQPRNASPLSVHPTGMAMDLRVSWKRGCRAWLEGTLIQLEKAGVLEAARERHPPHYHVVLFPRPYLDYVERLTGRQVLADTGVDAYRVQRGDNLWRIARRHGTTVERIREANDLPGNLIRAGQVLAIPRN